MPGCSYPCHSLIRGVLFSIKDRRLGKLSVSGVSILTTLYVSRRVTPNKSTISWFLAGQNSSLCRYLCPKHVHCSPSDPQSDPYIYVALTHSTDYFKCFHAMSGSYRLENKMLVGEQCGVHSMTEVLAGAPSRL